MQMPVQITSRQLDLTQPMRNSIIEQAKKLERFYQNIIACRVTISTPHKHKHKGRLHNLSIDLTIPGKEIVVKHEPNEDLYMSIRDAFDVAKRQLRACIGKRRADIKHKPDAELDVAGSAQE